MIEGSELLNSLMSARWATASLTYGCSHSTLIGLIVDWWVSSSPSNRYALESGPCNESRPRGKGRGNCDAILCQENKAVGIVEVEGGKILYIIDKIDSFFKSRYDFLKPLTFAVLVLYPISPKGKGEARAFPDPLSDLVSSKILEISTANPDKPIIAVVLRKSFERFNKSKSDPRSRNEYYSGHPCGIEGILYLSGRRISSMHFGSSV